MNAGVDGCKAGWVAAIREADGPPVIRVFAAFTEIVDALPPGAFIVVDMPIGLPDRAGHGGRGPEALVRRHLGERQSSVFSIPSRAAVHAEPGPWSHEADRRAAHRRTCEVARATSEPPRACSIQAFGIFGKIRELDALMISRPYLRLRVVESHPEAAFWRLNGEAAMKMPKKVRGAVHQPGMEERKALLARHGLPRALLDLPAPAGAAADDVLDACAMLMIAERRAAGLAVPFPDPPLVDRHGIPVAIWT